MKPLIVLLPAFAVIGAFAQETVAPSRERVGRARGEDRGNYNIVQSYELGIRQHEVSGNEGKYRSDVNFGNGVRLLSSSFSLNSKDGMGTYIDELTVNTQGLAGDPYQFASVRAAKGNFFRYDMIWRLNEYFNPALAISDGNHLLDTQRRLQDHELTLFPRGSFRIFAGYSRSAQTGLGLITVPAFNPGDDTVPLFGDIDRKQNEYRVGNEFKVLGFKIHWIRAWERFEDLTPYQTNGVETSPGGAVVNSYTRGEPYRGTTPSWRVNLFRESSTHWALNGRFTQSGGDRNFILDESAMGTDRFGFARNRQVQVVGDARRPVITGHLTFSLFPTSNFTFTNHSGYHSTKMEGDSQYTEVENSTLSFASINFQSLAIRNFTNATDLNWRATRWLQLRGGYQYADRRIESVERSAAFGFENTVRAEQSNHLHAGSAGVQVQPLKPLSIAFDAEIGRQSHPFFPTSDKDYHALNGRVLWKQRNLTLSALARTFYNFNSVSLAVHSSRGRHYSYDGSWSPRSWFSIDAGYSKIHTDTNTAISYFVAFQPIEGERSIWISNLHTGHLGVTFNVKNRVDFYVGYNRTQDTGDGRTDATTPAGDQGSELPLFRSVQTFPMAFESPLARVSVRLHEKLRWNAGYQFYHYREDFFAPQNYHAHTGYVSLLWTF